MRQLPRLHIVDLGFDVKVVSSPRAFGRTAPLRCFRSASIPKNSRSRPPRPCRIPRRIAAAELNGEKLANRVDSRLDYSKGLMTVSTRSWRSRSPRFCARCRCCRSRHALARRDRIRQFAERTCQARQRRQRTPRRGGPDPNRRSQQGFSQTVLAWNSSSHRAGRRRHPAA